VRKADGDVITDAEVIRVHHDRGTGRVTHLTIANEARSKCELRADTFVVTMPLTDLVLRLTPPPPEPVLRAAKALKYRTHISVNFLLEGNPFPDNWVYVHSPELRVGRVANYANFSDEMRSPEGHSPLTFEYFAFDNDGIASQQDQSLIELALREGRQAKLIDGRPPKDAFVVRNSNAYCVIERGYEDHCRLIQEYLASLRNLRPAGRAGMFKYNNQDHSIMTGILAAENIMGRNHDVWNVNITAEYHESGTAPDLCEEDRQQMELK